MKLHKLKVTSRKQVQAHPRLWIELSWMLGDGNDSRTAIVSDGFSNENELIALYHLWKTLESKDLNRDLTLIESSGLLEHYQFTNDYFMDEHIPSDPTHGYNYKLMSVTLKGYLYGFTETYDFV